MVEYEPSHIAETKKFYSQKSSDWIDNLSVFEHLQHISKYLDMEIKSVVPSHSKTLATIHTVLITSRIRDLLNSDTGLVWMLDNEYIQGLELFYNVLRLVETGHTDLKSALSLYVSAMSQTILKEIQGGVRVLT